MNPLVIFVVWMACWLYVAIGHVLCWTASLTALGLLYVARLAFHLRAVTVGTWLVLRAEWLLRVGVAALD